MRRAIALRARPRPKKTIPAADEKLQRTREALLEAAGNVFAEKGFDRATGKEICERAGANAAAVNYYFGGVEGLYAAVLRLAHNRVVSVDHLQAVVADEPDARSQLEAILGMFARAVTGPASSSWVFRVIGREVVAPSRVFSEMRDKEIFPKLRILRPVVAELMGLREDHAAVARACISIVAPCVLLLIGDRRFLKQAFPSLGFDDPEAITQHLVSFALAGIASSARTAREAVKRNAGG
ncbi:MAG TPA: CerR family C-terminal domain-containing protein [Stellaceae bacterium]|jgi:AcrR family transcriptional regulator|nr:CerR family C-terminal domain-containing protein [Stellaceae bacterium]